MQKLRFSDYCANCRKSLQNMDTVYFVEREIGRCFCDEECIKGYFHPIVDYMEEDLRRLRSADDFQPEESEKFDDYQQQTLEDPDEVWMEQLESGERYFTFISVYNQEERFYYVVVCLAIDGVPSFVFLNFATKDEDLVEHYRKGEELKLATASASSSYLNLPDDVAPELATPLDEQIEKIYSEYRQLEDIPKEHFSKFGLFIEPTLDDPDEIWSFSDINGESWYTFIARHSTTDENMEFTGSFAMIVVCQSDAKTATLNVISAIPTIDPAFVQQFRKGINSLNKAFGIGGARRHAA